MSQPEFKSGRTGRGGAFTADRSGSHHARLMRISSYALMPLGIIAAWYVVGAVGKSYDELRVLLGRPFPALALLAFALISVFHMRLGAECIIDDYVHDEKWRTLALDVNKWAAAAVGAAWTLAIMLIAAPH